MGLLKLYYIVSLTWSVVLLALAKCSSVVSLRYSIYISLDIVGVDYTFRVIPGSYFSIHHAGYNRPNRIIVN